MLVAAVVGVGVAGTSMSMSKGVVARAVAAPVVVAVAAANYTGRCMRYIRCWISKAMWSLALLV